MNLKELMEKDRRIMEDVYIRGNMDAFGETHSTDMIVHMPPMADTHGLNEAKQSLMASRQGCSDMKIEWGDSVCGNDTIAQQVSIHVKHTGTNPMFPVPPTGKELVLRGSVFLHVKNGKIVEEFQFFDFLGYMQPLGIIPPIGQ